MRIRAVQSKLPTHQVAALTQDEHTTAILKHHFDVDVGCEYQALGLYFHRGVAWVYIVDEFDRLRVAPLALFTIVDGAIPASWVVSMERSEGAVFVAPIEMSNLTFADKVDEQDPEAVAVFNRMLARGT